MQQPSLTSVRRPHVLKPFPFKQAPTSQAANAGTIVRGRCYFPADFKGNINDVIKSVSTGVQATWNKHNIFGGVRGGIRVLRNPDNTARGLEVSLYCRRSKTDILKTDLRRLSSSINAYGRWELPATHHYNASFPLAVFLGDSRQPVFQVAVLSNFPPNIDLTTFLELYQGKDEVFPGGVLHSAAYEVSDTGMVLLDAVRIVVKGYDGGFACDPPSTLQMPGAPPIGVHLCMQRVPELPKVSMGPAPAPDPTPCQPPSHAPTVSSATSSPTPAPSPASHVATPSPPAPSTTPVTPSPPQAPSSITPLPSLPPLSPPTSVAPMPFVAIVLGEPPAAGGRAAPASGSSGIPMQPVPLALGKRRAAPSPCVSSHGSISGGDAASVLSEDTAMHPGC